MGQKVVSNSAAVVQDASNRKKTVQRGTFGKGIYAVVEWFDHSISHRYGYARVVLARGARMTIFQMVTIPGQTNMSRGVTWARSVSSSESLSSMVVSGRHVGVIFSLSGSYHFASLFCWRAT